MSKNDFNSYADSSFPEVNDTGSEDYYFFNDSASLPDIDLPSSVSVTNQLVPVVLTLICIVGLVGNGLVILVIVRYMTMRKVTYIYLVNLAAVEIVYLVTVVPVTTIAYASANWAFGETACKATGYIASVCLLVCILTLTATGLDRYLAVMHPVRFRTLRTEKKALIAILAIWMFSMVAMAPRMHMYNEQRVVHVSSVQTYCNRKSVPLLTRQVDTCLVFAGTYLLPQIVLIFCHLKIGLKLWTSRRPGIESQNTGVLGLSERRRIAKIVFAITLAFGICWLPNQVNELTQVFIGSGDTVIFQDGILILSFSFAANGVNPILYCLLSKHFRKYFKRALTCEGHNRARVMHASTLRALQTTDSSSRRFGGGDAVINDVLEQKLQNAIDLRPEAAGLITCGGVKDRTVAVAAGIKNGYAGAPVGSSDERRRNKKNSLLTVAPFVPLLSNGSCQDSGHESDNDDPPDQGYYNGHAVWMDQMEVVGETDRNTSCLPKVV